MCPETCSSTPWNRRAACPPPTRPGTGSPCPRGSRTPCRHLDKSPAAYRNLFRSIHGVRNVILKLTNSREVNDNTNPNPNPVQQVENCCCYFVKLLSIAFSVSVCMSVCKMCDFLNTYLKTHVKTSQTFLYTLILVVARSSSDNDAILYVLPVLYMTSYLHTMEPTVRNRRQAMFRPVPVRQVAVPEAKLLPDCRHDVVAADGVHQAVTQHILSERSICPETLR